MNSESWWGKTEPELSRFENYLEGSNRLAILAEKTTDEPQKPVKTKAI